MSKLAVVLLTVLLASVCRGQVDFFQPKLKNARACGLIVDRQGEGIPGATLSFTSSDAQKFQATSNEAGRFFFEQIRGAQWKLDARANGFIPASGIISSLKKASASSCKKPIYIVMGIGTDDYSYLTTSHAELIHLKGELKKGKKE